MFELDEYEEEQNYILVARKLEMHGNQKTRYVLWQSHALGLSHSNAAYRPSTKIN